MSANDRDKIWELYVSLGEGERHFNDLENKYRLLSSSWLLGMFIGLGFIFTQAQVATAWDPYAIATALGFLTAFGITLIWNLDIRVYHRLLDGYFVQGLVLERDYTWLPLIRTKMVFSQYVRPSDAKPDGGVMRRIKMFYVGSVGVPLAIGSCFLGITLSKVEFSLRVIVMLVSFALSCLWLAYIWTKSTSPLLGAFVYKHKEEAVRRLQLELEAQQKEERV